MHYYFKGKINNVNNILDIRSIMTNEENLLEWTKKERYITIRVDMSEFDKNMQ